MQEEEDAADLFTIDGRPARFHLYTAGYGKLTQGQVDELWNKIVDHGGIIVDENDSPDTIIAQYMGVPHLRQKYWLSRTVWIEEPMFIQTCINTGQYMEIRSRPVRKGMGGRLGPRTAFTPEDDRHLAEYLAACIPYKEEGARTGHSVYKYLMQLGEDFEDFQWALRHTEQSWRERYRKRQETFDPVIEHIVEQNPPREDGKGLYELSRRFGPRARKRAQIRHFEEEEEGEYVIDKNDELYEEGASAEAGDNPSKRRQSRRDSGAFDDIEERGHLSKRARYTDPASRHAPPVEQGRSTQHPNSFSHPARPSRRSMDFEADEELPFELPGEYEEDDAVLNQLVLDDEERPGPEDAGPSYTQRTPSPSISERIKRFHISPQNSGAEQTRPRPRPRRPGMPDDAWMPMSSQATMVNPTQNQLPRPAELSDTDEETEADARRANMRANDRGAEASPSRRVPEASNGARDVQPAAQKPSRGKRIMVVEIPPFAGSPPKSRRRPTPVNASAAREADDSREVRANEREQALSPSPSATQGRPGDSRSPSAEAHVSKGHDIREMGADVRERAPSPSDQDTPQTQENDRETHDDEENVENLLSINIGTSHSSIAGSASTKSQSSHPFDVLDSDDERIKQSLFRQSTSQSLSMRSRLSDRTPKSPVSVPSDDSDGDDISRLSRLSHHATKGSFVSESDQESTVPMTGTRAREAKDRETEEIKRIPYTPPSGTRAAAAATLSLRSRNVRR
ncbi:hypothetical protein WOLCODRAFT_136314 [Wolfiporia cocos MD-104 SS10]|uniref:BRCT domain-containing protein n=1 Tax=Wolfiporia cocos (strain MD-104) TaxID=742152 RepID=A0A2H3JLA8_WOLCO|nr:hypothetical protein WOLCODRAFT_136314 [Wolfiporia cocos MD-104 SS10]